MRQAKTTGSADGWDVEPLPAWDAEPLPAWDAATLEAWDTLPPC